MEKLFGEILSMSVDSSWLIVAVIAVRAIMQKSPKYFRKILWALVGVRLVIPFSYESALSLIPYKVPQTADRVVEQVVTAPVEQGVSFTKIATFLWLGVALVFLIYGIFSYIKLKLKLLDGVLVKENIYQSDRIQSPFVCGFLNPKIYMPYGLDEATQSCVLQHEKTHIKYADHFIKATGFIVLCVHWFNPLVWVSYFLLCKDIELSCDESVIKKLNEVQCKQYAKALLDLGVSKVKLSACPIAFGEVSIKTRIKSVISYKKASKILVFASLCLCIGVSLCFMTEPEASLKKKADEVEVVEVTTEPTTEIVTEPTTEATTEPAAEITTKLSVKETQSDSVQDESPVYDEEFKAELKAKQQEAYEEIVFINQREFLKYNSSYNNVETTTDSMYQQAREKGIFVDFSENDQKLGFFSAYNVDVIED